MFIYDLELHLCKRFSLPGFTTVKIKPGLKTQMILGSNGSGKSSILKVGFSVMPAVHTDYYGGNGGGGFKTMRVLHNGKDYYLATRFEKSSPEHIFICNDEELNIGHTGAVQKELIREHFKMTQEIHDVLCGEEKFTSMTPLRRREWITKLSDTDFTYVLGLYSNVKKGARDAAAVVKHNSGRLVTESSKLMEGADLDMLVKRSGQLREELDILLQECSNGSDQVQRLRNELYGELRILEQDIGTCLKKTNLAPPDTAYLSRSEDDLEQSINLLNNEINGLQMTLEEVSRLSQHMEGQMRELQLIEGMDEQYLRNRSVVLEADVIEKLRYLHTGEPFEEISCKGGAQETIHEFNGLVYELSGGQLDKYSPEVLGEKHSYLERLYNAQRTLSANLGNVEGRLQHIDTCQESGCPKCGHTFKNGIDPSEYETLKASSIQGKEKLLDIAAQIVDIREYLQGADKHQGVLNAVLRFRQNHPELSNFWGYIDKSGGIGVGKELVPAVHMYLVDIQVTLEIKAITSELKPIREAIASIDALNGEGSSIREQYYLYISRITEITDNIRKKNAEIDVLIDYSLRQSNFDKQLTGIDGRVKQIGKLQDELIEAIRQSELRGIVKDNQISLAMVETSLTETEVQQGIVNDIRKEIASVSIEEQAYKAIADTLSPVDGLIAEQISIYINSIIDRMNAAIARVWGYNMAIKPCDVADGDLDYKFPLYTVSADNDIPDVSKGSDSQIDIVDQAFRLIVYKFLDLHDYPLYLDELGRSFDEVHRHNLIPAVKDMIDDSTYSQIFMISHYVDGQNSYPNSEIVVLDGTHLTLKRSFNDHVTFN